jgi:hypothetical protein
MGHFLYNLGAFGLKSFFAVQASPLNPARDLPAEDPESFSATSTKKEQAPSWKQEQ